MFTSLIKDESCLGSYLACSHRSVVVAREMASVSFVLCGRTFNRRNVLRLVLESGAVVFVAVAHASNPMLKATVGSQFIVSHGEALVIQPGVVLIG